VVGGARAKRQPSSISLAAQPRVSSVLVAASRGVPNREAPNAADLNPSIEHYASITGA
jgi:hypothetical protein